MDTIKNNNNNVNNKIRIIKQLADIKNTDNNITKELTLDISITNSGLPCLYEKGGAYAVTSYAQIITDSKGNPKKPVYIFTKGDLCNQNHAVIPITTDDLVFIAEGDRNSSSVLVYNIIEIDIENRKSKLSLSDFDDSIIPFIAVANKSWTYHCRKPHYIIDPTTK